MSNKGGVIGSEKRTFIGPGDPNKNGDPLGPGYYETDYAEMSSKNKKKGVSFAKTGRGDSGSGSNNNKKGA